MGDTMKTFAAIAFFSGLLATSAQAGDWVCQGVCGYSTGSNVLPSRPLIYGLGQDPSVARAFDIALQQCAGAVGSAGSAILVNEVIDQRGYVHYVPVAIAQACVRD
jgi:hypothetical protein